MKNLILSLFAASLFSGCGTMVSYNEAQRAASEYREELDLIEALPDDYGALIDSLAARRAWRQQAESTPGLERLAAVWVFERRRDIDTAVPYTAKAVVVPGMILHPLQERQMVDGLSWGKASGEHYSVQREGSSGRLVAFFRR